MRRNTPQRADDSLSRPMSRLTLLEVPPTPGALTIDLCWAGFVSAVDETFEENCTRYEAYLDSSGAELRPKDKQNMDDLRETFDKLKTEHKAASKSMKIGKARKKAHFLKLKCSEMKDVTKGSCKRAQEHKILAEGYTLMIEHRVKPLSLIEFQYSNNPDSTPRHLPKCRFGLRPDTVNRLIRWLKDENRRPIHLIKGEAGCGKSVLLHTLAELCTDKDCPVLGASYVFTPNLTGQDFHQSFVATMVDEVAKYAPDLKEAVYTIKPTNDDFRLKSIKAQTATLFVNACEAAFNSQDLGGGTPRVSNFLVIFDGLDHCNSAILRGAFDFMAECIKALPQVHFVIASRFTPKVVDVIRGNALEDRMEVTEMGNYRQLLSEYLEDFRLCNSTAGS